MLIYTPQPKTDQNTIKDIQIRNNGPELPAAVHCNQFHSRQGKDHSVDSHVVGQGWRNLPIIIEISFLQVQIMQNKSKIKKVLANHLMGSILPISSRAVFFYSKLGNQGKYSNQKQSKCNIAKSNRTRVYHYFVNKSIFI